MSAAAQIVAGLAPTGGWFHDPATTDDLTGAVKLLLAVAKPDVVELAVSQIVGAISNEYGE